jgi:hypothetical protein
MNEKINLSVPIGLSGEYKIELFDAATNRPALVRVQKNFISKRAKIWLYLMQLLNFSGYSTSNNGFLRGLYQSGASPLSSVPTSYKFETNQNAAGLREMLLLNTDAPVADGVTNVTEPNTGAVNFIGFANSVTQQSDPKAGILSEKESFLTTQKLQYTCTFAPDYGNGTFNAIVMTNENASTKALCGSPAEFSNRCYSVAPDGKIDAPGQTLILKSSFGQPGVSVACTGAAGNWTWDIRKIPQDAPDCQFAERLTVNGVIGFGGYSYKEGFVDVNGDIFIKGNFYYSANQTRNGIVKITPQGELSITPQPAKSGDGQISSRLNASDWHFSRLPGGGFGIFHCPGNSTATINYFYRISVQEAFSDDYDPTADPPKPLGNSWETVICGGAFSRVGEIFQAQHEADSDLMLYRTSSGSSTTDTNYSYRFAALDEIISHGFDFSAGASNYFGDWVMEPGKHSSRYALTYAPITYYKPDAQNPLVVRKFGCPASSPSDTAANVYTVFPNNGLFFSAVNLQKPITKLSTQSMKVTYTLNFSYEFPD